MRNSKKDTRNYLLDTNVFIAAIKDPRKETRTLQLILAMIEGEEVHLIGDEFLAEEMVRYAEGFKSVTVSWILSALLDKMELIDVGENFIKICKNYIKTPNKADILHAAVCLKSDTVLITNDTHFDKIRDEGIIRVWGISRGIKKLL